MISQDERAYQLMDRLFAGQAQTIDFVEEEFKAAKIPAFREYLTMYKVHITRERIGGKIWAYMWDVQKKRIEDDVAAGDCVQKILRLYDADWDRIPIDAFRRWPTLKTRISSVLRDMGVYIDAEFWNRYLPVGGRFVSGYRELSLENRNWMFDELEYLESHLWLSSAEDVWKQNYPMWEHRVTEVEFSRCFELSKMYESTDVKAIFPVSS